MADSAGQLCRSPGAVHFGRDSANGGGSAEIKLLGSPRTLASWTKRAGSAHLAVVAFGYPETSLFCIRKSNTIRQLCILLSHSKQFENFILFCILCNCITLGMSSNRYGFDHTSSGKVLDKFEYLWVAIFSAEALLKIVSMGFFLAPGTYLRDGWNVIDFGVVALGLVDIFTSGNMTAVRTVRVLRPLRAITRIQGVKVLVTTMLASMPMLLDVFFLCGFTFFVWGIVAVQLFAGVLKNRCGQPDFNSSYTTPLGDGRLAVHNVSYIVSDDGASTVCSGPLASGTSWTQQPGGSSPPVAQPGPRGGGFVCPADSYCTPYSNPNYDKTSFDNILWAWLTIFQCITLESWTDVMYFTSDAVSWWVWPFFVALVVFGAFFLVSLALAVIFLQFSSENHDTHNQERQQQQQKRERMEREWREKELQRRVGMGGGGGADGGEAALGGWERSGSVASSVLSMADVAGMKPLGQELSTLRSVKSGTLLMDEELEQLSPTRLALYRLAVSRALSTATIVLILVNTVVMCVNWYGMPYKVEQATNIINLSLTCYFAVELLVKLAAFGFRRYFSDGMNIFDFIVVVVSVAELIVSLVPRVADVGPLSVMRMLRLLRVFRLARNWRELYVIIHAILRSVMSTTYLMLLMLLFMFIAALTGMQLFGYKFMFCDYVEGASAVCPPGQEVWGECPNYFYCYLPCGADQYGSWIDAPGSFYNDLAYCDRFCASADAAAAATTNASSAAVAAATAAGCEYLAMVGKSEVPRAQFDNLFWAMFTVFQLLTGENWNNVMYDGMRTTSQLAAVYFIVVILIGTYLVFNLFIAILLDNFSGALDSFSEDLDKDDEPGPLGPRLTDRGKPSPGGGNAPPPPPPPPQRPDPGDPGEEDAVGISWHLQARNELQRQDSDDSGSGSESGSGSGSGSDVGALGDVWPEGCGRGPGGAAAAATAAGPGSDSGRPDPAGGRRGEVAGWDGAPAGAPGGTGGTVVSQQPQPAGEPKQPSLFGLPRAASSGREADVSAAVVAMSPRTCADDRAGSGQGPGGPAGPGPLQQAADLPDNPREVQQGAAKKRAGGGRRRVVPVDADGRPSSDPPGLARVEPQELLPSAFGGGGRSGGAALQAFHAVNSFGASGFSSRADPDFGRRPAVAPPAAAPPPPTSARLQPTSAAAAAAAPTASCQHRTPDDDAPPSPAAAVVYARSYGARILQPSLSSLSASSTASFASTTALHGRGLGAIGGVLYRSFSRAVSSLRDVRRHEDFSALIRGRSLLLLGPEHWLRWRSLAVVHNSHFESAMLIFIAASSVALALDAPSVEPTSRLSTALRVMDYVFTAVFTVEAGLKIVTFGFAFTGPHAYVRSGWNVLDLVIVCVGWALLIVQEVEVGLDKDSSNLHMLRVLRTLRALRPLRAASRYEGLRVVVNALFAVLPAMANVALVCLLFYVVFAILAVNLFKGKLYNCIDADSGERIDPFYVLPYGQELTRSWCEAGSRTITHSAYHSAANITMPEYSIQTQWIKPRANFDNVGIAMLTLFNVATLELWLDIAFSAVDATGVGSQPLWNHSPAVLLFFVLFITVCSFFILNVFVGVTLEKVAELQREQTAARVFVTPQQQAWVEVQKLLLRTAMLPRPSRPEEPAGRRALFDLVTSAAFGNAITAFVLANTVFMALVHAGMSDSWQAVMSYSNLVFTFIFLVEAALKIIAFGSRAYFRDGWNTFDFLVAVVSGASVVLDFSNTRAISFMPVLRVLRVVRVIRLIRRATGVQRLLMTLVYSLPALVNVGGIMLLFFSMYAIVGMNVFGDMMHGTYLNRHSNFNNFPNAMLVLMRIITGESWDGIMLDCMVTRGCVRITTTTNITTPAVSLSSPLPSSLTTPAAVITLEAGTYLDPSDPLLSSLPANATDNQCAISPAVAVLYFPTFVILCGFILLNLVIAVILENMMVEEADEALPVSRSIVGAFVDAWGAVDPAASGAIHASELPLLIGELEPPLGTRGMPNRSAIQTIILSVDIPVHQNNKVTFLETLHALAGRLAGTELPEIEEERIIGRYLRRLPGGGQVFPKYTAAHFHAALYVKAAVQGFLARHNMRQREQEMKLARAAAAGKKQQQQHPPQHPPQQQQQKQDSEAQEGRPPGLEGVGEMAAEPVLPSSPPAPVQEPPRDASSAAGGEREA
ncbi:Caveolin-2 [Pleodorina starrii]|nr:Caveolin-2 [Pleodorina starrii]